MGASSWQAQVYAALKAARITQLGYVPDAGHAELIEAAHADPEMRAVVLTTEEEGIALAAAGVHVRRADRPDEVAELVAASAALAFDSAVPVAVLFSQRLVGAKVFTQ